VISLPARPVLTLTLWVCTTILVISSSGRATRGQDDSPFKPREVTGVVVDEAGKPVAGVEVDTLEATLAKRVRTDEKGAFRFLLDPNLERDAYAGLVIARDRDVRMGLARLPLLSGPIKPRRIVLKNAKEIKIRVVDGSDRPVENAGVYSQVNGTGFPVGFTDASGNWAFRLPDEPRDWLVSAFKGGVGYEYVRAAGSEAPAPASLPPLPSRVLLRLTGSRRPVHIRTVDHQGKPVPDVWITIHEKGFLFAGFVKSGQTARGPIPMLYTGEDGTLTIDWLPHWAKPDLTYLGLFRGRKYEPKDPGGLACDPNTGEVELVMFPTQVLSGRITLSDGNPAAGASVRIISLTRVGGPFPMETKADGSGRYKILVRSQDDYVIYASLNDAAQFRRDAFLVTPDKPVNDIGLVITRAAKVKGRVSLDRDGKAIPRFGRISVWTSTGPLAPEVRELLPGGSKQAPVIMFTQICKDEEFRLSLPWGNYTLRFSHLQDKTMQHHDVPISIPLDSRPLEIKRDFILSEIPKVE
jgi:hypothetical protein